MGGKAGAGISIMTDPIRKAIEASRERERLAKVPSHVIVGAPGYEVVLTHGSWNHRTETLFREALAVAVEGLTEIERDATDDREHNMARAALARIERLLAGGEGT